MHLPLSGDLPQDWIFANCIFAAIASPYSTSLTSPWLWQSWNLCSPNAAPHQLEAACMPWPWGTKRSGNSVVTVCRYLVLAQLPMGWKLHLCISWGAGEEVVAQAPSYYAPAWTQAKSPHCWCTTKTTQSTLDQRQEDGEKQHRYSCPAPAPLLAAHPWHGPKQSPLALQTIFHVLQTRHEP